jgi:hypothetical protein
MKAIKPTKAGPGSTHTSTKISEEIKTDFPLSEKDEVKQAEKNLQGSGKKKD